VSIRGAHAEVSRLLLGRVGSEPSRALLATGVFVGGADTEDVKACGDSLTRFSALRTGVVAVGAVVTIVGERKAGATNVPSGPAVITVLVTCLVKTELEPKAETLAWLPSPLRAGAPLGRLANGFTTG
jgi:hypothetical protein